jgi:hypothetical protein
VISKQTAGAAFAFPEAQRKPANATQQYWSASLISDERHINSNAPVHLVPACRPRIGPLVIGDKPFGHVARVEGIDGLVIDRPSPEEAGLGPSLTQ